MECIVLLFSFISPFFSLCWRTPSPHQVKNMESLLLSAKLQDSYNTLTVPEDDNLQVYCPVIGQAYVALYDDKLWYRAQVIGEGLCKCIF